MLDAVFRLADDGHALAQISPLVAQHIALGLHGLNERLAGLDPVATVGRADAVEREKGMPVVDGRGVDDDAPRLRFETGQDVGQRPVQILQRPGGIQHFAAIGVGQLVGELQLRVYAAHRGKAPPLRRHGRHVDHQPAQILGVVDERLERKIFDAHCTADVGHAGQAAIDGIGHPEQRRMIVVVELQALKVELGRRRVVVAGGGRVRRTGHGFLETVEHALEQVGCPGMHELVLQVGRSGMSHRAMLADPALALHQPLDDAHVEYPQGRRSAVARRAAATPSMPRNSAAPCPADLRRRRSAGINHSWCGFGEPDHPHGTGQPNGGWRLLQRLPSTGIQRAPPLICTL